MREFKIEVEPGSVRISGPGAQVLLAGFLTRAKFGEAYDSLTLLNETLAEWLKAIAPPPRPLAGPAPRYGRDFIDGVAETIFQTAHRNGWYAMTGAAQVAFLREVVVVPNTIGDEDVEEIREAIQLKLAHSRRIVDAAGGQEP